MRNGLRRWFEQILREEMEISDGFLQFSVEKWRFLSVFCNSPWRNGDFRQFFAILRREIEISVGFLQFSVEKWRFSLV